MTKNDRQRATERYADWRSSIQSELDSFEGHGPPSVDNLVGVAKYEAQGVVGWIDDMPVNEETIQTAKGDVLKALVALEMAEERLEEDGNTSEDGGPSEETERHSVNVAYDAELDPDRVEEWVKANFSDGDQVQVKNLETGAVPYDNIGCSTL